MDYLVTGADGLLGTAIIKYLSKRYDVKGYGKDTLDVTNRVATHNILFKDNPKIIIHTAANTDAEDCEKNPDKAYSVNSNGTKNIVDFILSIKKQIILVYISSTGVYGKKQQDPYTENDIAIPTTIHHKSKLNAEGFVSQLENHLIIRTGWLFGGELMKKKNFVYNRLLEGEKNDLIYSDYEQRGNPTFVNDVCAQIELLILKKCYGLYNCVGEGVATRYEYVKEIISYSGLFCKVIKSPHKKFNRIAPVSFNESAINYKLNSLKINVMQPWEKALSDYVRTINLYKK